MNPVSFPERIAALARSVPNRVALAGDDITLNYGGLAARIDAVAACLAAWGVARGDRVAFLGFNHVDQITLLAALMRHGALLVPLNYRLASAELRSIAAHAGISCVVTDAHHAQAAAALGVAVHDVAVFAAPTVTASRAATSTALAPDTPALLVYTSGTTGEPKGAVHTQGGLYWNAAASIAMHGFTIEDRVLSALPMFHVGGLCIQTLPALYAGAQVTLHSRFEPGAWLDAVDRGRPTTSLMVPATMRAVLDHPRWQATNLSSLRLLGAGSSTIPDALIAAFHARGVPVCQIYGATETGPVSIVLEPRDAFARAGAAGRPALNCAIRLMGEDGEIDAAGIVGEIWVRGPNVMQGYWREPAHPAFVGGWFRTGDLARRDADGFHFVVGRSKDVIISGGENIYPAEIENVLADMPGVREAAVVGVPDARWGEVPVAVVVHDAGATIGVAEIRARCESRLARFKHPREIVFRASLPRNAMGKVQKHLLVAELQAPAPDA